MNGTRGRPKNLWIVPAGVLTWIGLSACGPEGPRPATEADVWGYQDRLVSCVQTATTLEQSEACRAKMHIDFCRRFTPCPEP